MNLKIDVWASPETADFWLTVQVYKNGQPIATITSLDINEPDLASHLRNIFHAFQMGTQHGQTETPMYPILDAPTIAGSDLPARGEGIVDTRNLIPLPRESANQWELRSE